MTRLSPDQARRLFSTARVARLATVSGGAPHLIPFTFAVDGDLVYTAVDAKPKSTTNLKRLANIRANPRVAVLADHYEDDWSALWWVRADGHATILAEAEVDADARAHSIGLLVERYPQYVAHPPEGPVIAIRVTRWTGWSATPT